VSDFIGNAVGAADDGAEGEHDLIEPGSCIIAELGVELSGEDTFCLVAGA
jgi:hypothetical protein